MKIQTLSIIVIIFSLFVACTPRPNFSNYWYTDNKSGVDIVVIYDGGENKQNTLTIKNGERVNDILYSRNVYTVIFDGKYTVMHYRDELVHEGKYLNIKSKNSLTNPDSYITTVDYDESHRKITDIFTFTPEDYEFAKQ